MLLAVLTRKSSRHTCGPMPTVAPDASLPGLALAYCTSSCSVFAGTAGFTTSALESNAIRPTAVKSLIGSKSSVRARQWRWDWCRPAATCSHPRWRTPRTWRRCVRRRHVGRAGRRIEHDDLDQAVGVGLGAGETRARETDGDGDGW